MDKERKFNKSADELNERINNLYGVGNGKPTKTSNLSEADKKEMKKQLVFLIWIVVITIGVLIFLSVHSLLNWDISEPENTNRPIEIRPSIPNGSVDVSNEVIQSMANKFAFNSYNPLYEKNILNLLEGNIEVNKLDFQTKMLLLTSTEEFNTFMFTTTNLKKYNPAAEYNLNITFTEGQLENIAKTVLGEDIVLEHEDFSYAFAYTTESIIYFKAELKDGVYTLNVIDNIKSSFNVYHKLIGAEKMDSTYYLKYAVLYSNSTGIYRDKGFTEFLTSNILDLEKYISRGEVYQFIFNEITVGRETSYYLSDIKLAMSYEK